MTLRTFSFISLLPLLTIRWTFLLLLLILPLRQTGSDQVVWSPRHVDTKLGVVQGYVVHPLEGGQGVEVILNLPYASPPLGTLRFMPPVSASPWSGVRRSRAPSPVCPQAHPDLRDESEALKVMPKGRLSQLRRLLPLLRNQSEDCLYLNLFVPLKVAEGVAGLKAPVLVFIHGDDYGWGGGHPYDPSVLVSYGNIIVVTLNYRLGILGFLNANSDSHFRLPYNFAMLDIIAALQWIQENIALFGGDRFNVTLMGHGKGAVLVNFLMVSSAVPTGLLFHRVILSSGSALSPLVSDLSTGPELARRFAVKVKCPAEPSSTMLECLRELPVKLFLDSEYWSLFGPSGDGIVVRNEGPSDTLLMNRASHYPMLFGVVRVEALWGLSDQDATYGMETERRRELLREFINKYYRFHRNEILAGAIHEYTDWERPVHLPQNVREETLDALADAQVVAPMTKVGDLHSQSSRSRAYFYVFEYQSKSSEYQQRLGCVHGEELPYLFGSPLASSSHRPPHELGFFTGNFTPSEAQLSVTVMTLWANFVRIGNPNGDSKADGKEEASQFGWKEKAGHKLEGNVQDVDEASSNRLGMSALGPEPVIPNWPLYDSMDKKYLLLDLKPRVKGHYRAHKLSFWLHLVPDYQKSEEEDEALSVPPSHHIFPLQPSPETKAHNSSLPSSKRGKPPLLVVPTGETFLPHDQQHDSGESKSSSSSASRSKPLVVEEYLEGVGEEEGGEVPSRLSNLLGFEKYSTALSVTIAIGLSLFILNVLIFATFYYEREKRLNAMRRAAPSSSSSSIHITPSNRNLVHHISEFPMTTQSSSSSNYGSLKRRKEPTCHNCSEGEEDEEDLGGFEYPTGTGSFLRLDSGSSPCPNFSSRSGDVISGEGFGSYQGGTGRRWGRDKGPDFS